jgi:hypothetical protein
MERLLEFAVILGGVIGALLCLKNAGYNLIDGHYGRSTVWLISAPVVFVVRGIVF